MTKLPTSWASFEPCPKCAAGRGRPCRRPNRVICPPHVGRYSTPSRGWACRNPNQLSRIGGIIHQIMEQKGLRQRDISALLGWSKTYTSKVLSEALQPVSVAKAEKILGALGYRLEHRAVPIGNDDRSHAEHGSQ